MISANSWGVKAIVIAGEKSRVRRLGQKLEHVICFYLDVIQVVHICSITTDVRTIFFVCHMSFLEGNRRLKAFSGLKEEQ